MKRRFWLPLSAAMLYGLIKIGRKNQPSGKLPLTAYIDVAAATLWTEPHIQRSIDTPSLLNPADIRTWINNMSVDDKLWLVGKLETQALYGNKVTILDKKGKWVKVAVEGEPTPRNELGYPGWLPKKQLAFSKLMHKSSDKSFAMVKDKTTWLYNNKKLTKPFIEISFNTQLPVVNWVKNAVLVLTPGNGRKWLSAGSVNIYKSINDIPKPSKEDIVDTAEKFLGLPYLWSGMSGFGFDCSGFTHNIYKHHGIIIPRDASAQILEGEAVEKGDLQKGDLLFFAHDSGKGAVHHVGMYYGNDKMIHSPNSKSSIEILDDVWHSSYAEDYAGARRYLKSK
ncbi:NlpC/P60 family protein [Scopulibacillus cellulosilyticus]|uniref:NlpC/P60 family protein n=1 Tax=Scopulibacillus cellulosilyticus TaxID=2665665 RepID=A0ABW2PSF1_9BACL